MSMALQLRPDLVRFLSLAVLAARDAVKEILGVYAGGKPNILNKGDGTPITDEHLRAHASFSILLRASNLPVLSGAAVVPFEQRRNWKSFCLMDPLDGIKVLTTRKNDFTASIALLKKEILCLKW